MHSVDLMILVGIQASGKTTFYRQCLADSYIHVSLDNWRGKSGVRSKEHAAILAGLRAAAEGIGNPRGVVVDNTNTTAATRRRYFDYANEFSRESGFPVRVGAWYFDADLESCLRRNAQRPKDAPPGVDYFVPPGAIHAFRRRLEPPSYEEGFEEISHVRIRGDGSFEVERIPRANSTGP